MKARLIPVLALVVLTGCSKIHETRPFKVGPGQMYYFEITEPVSEQKIKVSVTSENPVNIWVMLTKEVPSQDEFDPATRTVLASEKNTKEATITATIPAKEKYRIYITGASKETSGTVKVDSQ